MNRYICILVASTFFLVSSVKAQLSFGIKGGGALTSLPGNISKQSSKAGFYAGVFGALPLHKSFSLQAELYYSAQGNKQTLMVVDTWDPVTGNISFREEKAPYRLNYLNLPFLIKYKTTSGFFVEAGLQAGLLISAHGKTSQGKFDVKENYKSFDLSGAAGSGYQFHNGLGVNLRYNRSLMSIYKWDAISAHHSIAQLGLYYFLSKR